VDTRLLQIIVVATAAFALAGCATGVRGSPRRICADAGYQPGTAEFSNCWRGVRDRMFAAETPAMALGLAAGVAANAPPPAAPAAPPSRLDPGFGTLTRNYVSGMNRICVYNTIRGDYTLTVAISQLCPLTPR
jgi:hypothetical protein